VFDEEIEGASLDEIFKERPDDLVGVIEEDCADDAQPE
jgi:hypothetical protein